MTALAFPDEEIRKRGQRLGRFSWSYHSSPGSTDPQLARPGGSMDWLADPNGTHDGYVYRAGFFALERT